MSAVKLTYFDLDGGRGEDCRLALHIAGVAFEDDRVAGPDWLERKPHTPFGCLPVLEIEGRGRLAQSNAILTFIGRTYGLHPDDPWEAAKHEALMGCVEELRDRLAHSLDIKEPEDKRKEVRQALASGPLQWWGANVEAQLGEGPFVAGDQLNVVDLKLFTVVRWLVTGIVDHIPNDVFKAFPKLMRLYETVRTHPGVQSWYAERKKRKAARA